VVQPSVARRVARIRNGGTEEFEGSWVAAGKSGQPVMIVLRADGITIPQVPTALGAMQPVAVLGRAARPRASNSHGIELDRGVILGAEHDTARLLARRADLAVLACIANWSPPADLHSEAEHD
jgi:hypothetical protein